MISASSLSRVISDGVGEHVGGGVAEQGAEDRGPAGAAGKVTDRGREPVGNRRQHLANLTIVPADHRATDICHIERAGEIGQTDDIAVLAAVDDPAHAQLRGAVIRHFGDDGLDQHLGAADIQLIDHRAQRTHGLARRGDHQRVGGRVRPDGDVTVASTRRRATLGRGRAGHQLADLFLEPRRQILGIGVAQIDDLRIAAGFQRRVQVRDQRADAQTAGPVAADQHAVGALVGDQTQRARRVVRTVRGLGQRGDDAHDIGGRGMLETDHLDLLVTGLVDARDDPHHPVHVGRAVGDDQHVGGRVGGEMPVLGDQRSQDRHQLGRADILAPGSPG